MLSFFRKYQKVIYIFVTVIIVISFSFFGTYSSLNDAPSNQRAETVAFVAVDGSEVKQGEVDELVYFISTDIEDKKSYNGAWGFNFLNDSVIQKDFLKPGIAELMISEFSSDLNKELTQRLEKEKLFSPYKNPQASFISADLMWTHFAPKIQENLKLLQTTVDPLSKESIKARVALYLAEKEFPSERLRQVFRYQESQYDWLSPDPQLNQQDLSLFGYHFIEDWFGKSFLELTSQTIINIAKMAEEKGYTVTDEEVIADLTRSAEISFYENQQSPYMTVVNRQQYLGEHLNRMGLTMSQSVKIWKKVLLFRRLVHDTGNSIFVDALPYKKFYKYAKKSVAVDLYQLPQIFDKLDYDKLQKFEIYLQSVAKDYPKAYLKKSVLELPDDYLSIDKIEKNTPELVKKHYRLAFLEVKKQSLISKINIKDTWEWELKEENWEILKKEFPILGAKEGQVGKLEEADRFKILESLDSKTRRGIDLFANTRSIKDHPEWLEDAFAQAEPQELSLDIHLRGGDLPFKGIKDQKKFISLLDQAPLAVKEGEEKVEQLFVSDDDEHYYKIQVLERAENKEIVSFSDALEKGLLTGILADHLQVHYKKIRGGNRSFLDDEGNWKPLQIVRSEVADNYFSPVLSVLYQNYLKSNQIKKDKELPKMTGELVSSYRFLNYMENAQLALQNRKEVEDLSSKKDEHLESSTPSINNLSDQWKWEKVVYSVDRSQKEQKIDEKEAFTLQEGAWSKIFVSKIGKVSFYQLKERSSNVNLDLLAKKMEEARGYLSDEAKRVLMQNLIKDFKEKKAINLNQESSLQKEG